MNMQFFAVFAGVFLWLVNAGMVLSQINEREASKAVFLNGSNSEILEHANDLAGSQLTEFLDDDDVELRRFASFVFMHTSVHEIASLSRALDDPDSRVRRNCAMAIMRNDPTNRDVIKYVMTKDDGWEAGFEELNAIWGSNRVAELEQMLFDEDTVLCRFAGFELAYVQKENLADPTNLVNALQHQDEDVQLYAAVSLLRNDPQQAQATQHVLTVSQDSNRRKALWAIRHLTRLPSQWSFCDRRLGELLREARLAEPVDSEAFEFLNHVVLAFHGVRSPSTENRHSLMELFDSKNTVVATSAMEVVAEFLGNDEQIETAAREIFARVRSKDVEISHCAAAALKNNRRVLRSVYRDILVSLQDDVVSEILAFGLAQKIAPRKEDLETVNKAISANIDNNVAAYLVSHLSNFCHSNFDYEAVSPPKEVLPSILKLAANDDPEVKKVATHGLFLYPSSPEAVKAITQYLEHADDSYALRLSMWSGQLYLYESGANQVVQNAFYPLLFSSSAFIRAAALEVYQEVVEDKETEVLERLLDDQNLTVRVKAARLLAHTGFPHDSLVEILIDGLDAKASYSDARSGLKWLLEIQQVKFSKTSVKRLLKALDETPFGSVNKSDLLDILSHCHLDSSHVTTMMAALSKARYERTRRGAAKCLGSIGADAHAALPLLQACLSDADAENGDAFELAILQIELNKQKVKERIANFSEGRYGYLSELLALRQSLGFEEEDEEELLNLLKHQRPLIQVAALDWLEEEQMAYKHRDEIYSLARSDPNFTVVAKLVELIADWEPTKESVLSLVGMAQKKRSAVDLLWGMSMGNVLRSLSSEELSGCIEKFAKYELDFEDAEQAAKCSSLKRSFESRQAVLKDAE